MNVEELIKVSEGLSWMSGRLQALPEDRKQAMQASVVCAMANLIVAELVKHLHDGVEPYEALRLTAVGGLESSASQRALWKEIVPKLIE